MSDLISRQAAIDAIKAASKEIQHWLWEAEGCEGYCAMVADVETCLDDLPSVQPEERTDKRTETHACDLISRQAALACFHDWIDRRGDVHTADEMPEYNAIEALPSAQPYTDEEIQKMQELEQAEIQKAYELGKLEAEQRWIPCSERLPEEYGDYLVTKNTIGWNCEEYTSNDIAYFDNDGFHKADTVIAWMPLPEPYKEEGEE